MCGIAGYTGPRIDGLLDRMVDAIRHRGPDGNGQYDGGDAHFGHARLAIVDLAHGQQPMVREDGAVAVTYNGEIYNYDDLRAAIEAGGKRCQTTCDTELLPLGYALFGLDLLPRLNGMFAFALHDRVRGEVHLVRDHLGIKPLYYAVIDGRLVFGSTAGAIAAHPAFVKRLRPGAVRDFLQFRYVPDGRHMFEGIETLPPGTVATWRDGQLSLRPFWQTPRPSRPEGRPDAAEAARWVDDVGAVLSDAVRLQLRADVPMGVFLSGGVDSTAMLHWGARHSSAPLTAYTFAMGDRGDETAQAAELARDHGATQVVLGEGGLNFDHLYDAVACMDLPVGDAIILPTYELCRGAARGHKVVLTGEGADEIFGGYVHYPVLRKLDRLRRVAPWLAALAPLTGLIPVPVLDRLFHYQASLGRLGRRKVGRLLGALGNPAALPRIASAVLDDAEIAAATALEPFQPSGDVDLSTEGLIHQGLVTWLPYQILSKMDALSMAHGLEARVPFLDHRLVELVARAPAALIMNGGENKVALRRLLACEGLTNAARPKHAFHVPVEEMYKQPLKRLCDRWLSPDEIHRHGILREAFVRADLAALDAGEFVASKRLITMVCLHMWLDAHGGTL